MRKKTLSFILTTILTMSLFAGCGKEEKSNVDNTPTVTVTVEPSTEPTADPDNTEEVEPTIEAEDTFSTDVIEKAGVVDGVSYSNSLIGFSLSVPETWLLYGTEETFDLLAETMDSDADTLKTQLKEQGSTYFCYGSDTQLSENGVPENMMIQASNMKLYAGLGIEPIIESISALVTSEFNAMGATCEITDPVKKTVNGQDIYLVSSKATFNITSGDTTTEEIVNQEYIYFDRDNVLISIIISTQSNDSPSMSTIIDSLSFQ